MMSQRTKAPQRKNVPEEVDLLYPLSKKDKLRINAPVFIVWAVVIWSAYMLGYFSELLEVLKFIFIQ